MLVFRTKCLLALGRFVMPALLVLGVPNLRAQEKPVVSLREFVSTEVRQEGFSLPKDATLLATAELVPTFVLVVLKFWM